MCAQKIESDSLKGVLEKFKSSDNADTSQLKVMNALSDAHRREGNYTEALQFAELAKSTAQTKLTGEKSDPAITLSLKKIITKSCIFIGNVNMARGNYPIALTSYLEGLKLAEEMDDETLISDVTLNIGNVYSYQNDYKNCYKYYFECLKVKEKLHDKAGIGKCYNNIGFAYISEGNYEEALKYHINSLKINSEINNKAGMAYAAVNIGNSNFKLKNYDDAIKYQLMGLKLREEIGSKPGITACYLNMGNIYFEQNKMKDAELSLTKGLEMAKQMGNKEYIQQAYRGLFDVENKKGNFKKALELFQLNIIYRDSLINEESTNKTVKLQMNYEFDKKETTAKLEQDKKDALAKEEKEKQMIITWSICGVLLLVSIFAVYAYRNYLQKQKANVEITKQKQIIEEKQKEILDSITYAKRIQNALLPSEKIIAKNIEKLLP